LPAGIPPDRYTVEVSLYDAGTGSMLGAVGPDGTFRGTRVRVGSVEIVPSADTPTVEELDIGERLDVSAESLRLIGMNPVTEEVLSGDTLSLELFWQAEGIPDADYRVRWRLRGPRDEVALELDPSVSPYATSKWSRGVRLRALYELQIPPHLPPGQWQITLNVLDEQGDPLWEQDRALAVVGVLPREREFTLPDDIPNPMDLKFWDRIHLRGYELPRSTVGLGESLPLTLYWEAEGPTERSYTLFVHLVGPDGQLAGQIDRIPGSGAAPTSSWAAGQVIVEEISLPVAHDIQAGAYGIAVGFYDAAYGGRLPLVDGDCQILDQDQVILPTQITVTQ